MIDILEFIKNKLEIVSKNQKLTEEEKEIYFEIFVNNVIENIAYEEATINALLDIRKREQELLKTS